MEGTRYELIHEFTCESKSDLKNTLEMEEVKNECVSLLYSSFHPRWSEMLGFSSVLLKQKAVGQRDCSIKSEVLRF